MIYITSIHQKENFVADPAAYKSESAQNPGFTLTSPFEITHVKSQYHDNVHVVREGKKRFKQKIITCAIIRKMKQEWAKFFQHVINIAFHVKHFFLIIPEFL